MKVSRTQEKVFLNFEEALNYEVFSDEDGWTYLKIPKLVDENTQRIVNAIDLENNCLVLFEDDDRIKILDFEIVIRN